MIELKHIVKRFTGDLRSVTAVNDVSLRINDGEIFGIIGFSGAGKSTLVRCINLLERPTSGQVLLDGVDLTGLSPASLRSVRRKIGMIFQHFNLMPSRTVFENIEMPLKLTKAGREERCAKIHALLSLVGLSEKKMPTPRNFRADKNSALRLQGLLPMTPRCFFAMKRPARLTPKRRARF